MKNHLDDMPTIDEFKRNRKHSRKYNNDRLAINLANLLRDKGYVKKGKNSGNLAKIIGEFIYDDIIKREGE